MAGTPLTITPATKVICCGHNYRAHITEMGHGLPSFPTLFTKFADTLTGPDDDIVIPAFAADTVDWEAELAVVVGAPIRHADRTTARGAIAGYTVANDISIRAWQRQTGQWLPGKAFEATTPIGDEVVDVDPAAGLRVECRVNGETVQSARTDDLLFDAADLLVHISAFTPLRPGDIVLTGTPAGVGAARDPQRFLADGDVVETEIESIGLLRNTIRVDATDHPHLAGEHREEAR